MSKAQDPGARFTAITQIGTELAVLIYFRKDIAAIATSWFKRIFFKKNLSEVEKSQAKLGWLIIIGSLPIVILGYFGKGIIETDLRSLWLIAIVMIVFGLILGIADHKGKSDHSLNNLDAKHGLMYGFAQSLALIPGVSRSGATIAMGRYLGYTREAALRYSFLLALPAVFGSGLYQLKNSILDTSQSNVFSLGETFSATVAAFIVGYIVIAWLLKFVTTHSFRPFIIYRVVLGSVILILLTTGVISA